jgi:hypothetical protein
MIAIDKEVMIVVLNRVDGRTRILNGLLVAMC